jgi:hypothetical protein
LLCFFLNLLAHRLRRPRAISLSLRSARSSRLRVSPIR